MAFGFEFLFKGSQFLHHSFHIYQNSCRCINFPFFSAAFASFTFWMRILNYVMYCKWWLWFSPELARYNLPEKSIHFMGVDRNDLWCLVLIFVIGSALIRVRSTTHKWGWFAVSDIASVGPLGDWHSAYWAPFTPVNTPSLKARPRQLP